MNFEAFKKQFGIITKELTEIKYNLTNHLTEHKSDKDEIIREIRKVKTEIKDLFDRMPNREL